MLRLDANEGRCILSEEDLREILSPEIARRYPMRELLEIPLAEKLGLPSSCVLATAGADDAIDRTIRSLAGPGGLIMSTSPGFVEFLEAAQRSSARFKEIKKDPFEPFPIDDICRCVRALTPRLLILSSPDNPSGVARCHTDRHGLSGAWHYLCLRCNLSGIFDTWINAYPGASQPKCACNR